jgi:centriolar protein POC1
MVMVWKSSHGSIVGGGSGSEAVSVTATKPRQASSGGPLSYNSPSRGMSRTVERPSTAPGTGMSRRTNAASASSPGRSPARGRENMGAAFNERAAAPGAGKEFVLEEIVAGGDVGDEGDDTAPTLRTEGPAIPRDQLPEVLAGTLDHIVGQLDMMTRTLAILDRRLSLQEDMMAKHVFNGSGGAEPDAI